METLPSEIQSASACSSRPSARHGVGEIHALCALDLHLAQLAFLHQLHQERACVAHGQAPVVGQLGRVPDAQGDASLPQQLAMRVLCRDPAPKLLAGDDALDPVVGAREVRRAGRHPDLPASEQILVPSSATPG